MDNEVFSVRTAVGHRRTG